MFFIVLRISKYYYFEMMIELCCYLSSKMYMKGFKKILLRYISIYIVL